MQDFRQALDTHFRFMGENDHLPYHLKGRRQRQDGRTLIARVMKDMGFKTGLEIGTRYGASTILWCENIPGLHMTCIDPYGAYRARKDVNKQNAVYEDAVTNLAPYNVNLIRESSADIHARFEDESFDFINIDGNHAFDAVVQDLIFYVPKVRKGGLVLVHDYFAFHQGGVVEAVDAYTKCHQVQQWFTTRDLEPTAFWQRGSERV